MSKSMNRVFLMGNLAQKPELRTSKAGKPYARLNLATNRYRGPGEDPATDWHSVFVFGPEAERCAHWLDRGALVFVEGSLSYWQIDSEDSTKRYQNAINADQVRFISYGRRSEEGAALENVDNSGTLGNHNAVAQL